MKASRSFTGLLTLAFLLTPPLVMAGEEGAICQPGVTCFKEDETKVLMKNLMAPVDKIVDAQIYESIDEAVNAQRKLKKPVREFMTADKKKFPSYSKCEKTFFRVVTVNGDTDKSIKELGWKSGYDRNEAGTGLPPSAPFAERIIQYVGIKGEKKPFPRNSTIIGVMEDPIRTLSVGWHTGYTTDPEKYMRMDEIEMGKCAAAVECKNIPMSDSTKIFDEDNKKRQAQGLPPRSPRYSTEGEWAVDRNIPSTCVKATYRVKYQKVDGVNYSGSY